MTGQAIAGEPSDDRAGGRIGTLEAGRGLAALAVVLFHANVASPHFGGPYWPWRALEHGVDFFFVLSGFIIMHVHGQDVGHPGRARDYALRRAIRLFPMLWLVAGGYALAQWLAGRPVVPGVLLTSLLLTQSELAPSPQVVWTLRHEILFYAAFLLLIVNRRLGMIVAIAWAAAVAGQVILCLLGRPLGGLPAFFLSTFQLEFLFGACVALLHRRRRFRPASLPFVLALAALALALVAEDRLGLGRLAMDDYSSRGAIFGTVLIGAAFAALVHALVSLERRIVPPAFLLLLGSASYAIYLVHTPLNSVVQRVAALLPEPARALGAGHALLAAGGVGAGIALHLLVERPVGAWLRRRLGARPVRASAPAAIVPERLN